MKEQVKGENQKPAVKEQKTQEPQKSQSKEHGNDPKVQKQPVHQSTSFSNAYPAIVEEIIGRTGTRGEIIQVRCKIIDGREKNKILRKNVKGPIRIKDILMLRETEIEARKLTQTRRS